MTPLTPRHNAIPAGNATTEDLWGAWEKASGQPIKKMMGQWTRQIGFPLLKLKSSSADNGRTTLELSQRWFLADGSIADADEEKVWMIPVFAQASGAPESEAGMMHLLPAAPQHSITVEGDGAWVKLNAGQHVPMRVRYPDGMIPPLCSAIQTKAFGAADRIGLLSDQAALSRAGMLDPALYLQVSSLHPDVGLGGWGGDNPGPCNCRWDPGIAARGWGGWVWIVVRTYGAALSRGGCSIRRFTYR